MTNNSRKCNGWRRLPRSAVLCAGDKRVYAGGLIGSKVLAIDVGMTVAAAGYFGAVRKKAKTK